MKICAITMVYKDYWALDQWYHHYAHELGAENLIVVAHGADPNIAGICPSASILTIPRDDLSHFDRARAALLNGIQTGLLNVYDWVIRTDADELICAEKGLHNAIANYASYPVLTPLGFDLVEQPNDAPIGDGSVFKYRRHVAFAGHYSKAAIIRVPANLSLHGVQVPARRLHSFPYFMPPDIFLAHIKFANKAALVESTRTRIAVASGSARGLPGPGWKNADDDAVEFFEAFAKKKRTKWPKASAKAHSTLSTKPIRDEKQNLVKARALKFEFRTKLPEWFTDQTRTRT